MVQQLHEFEPSIYYVNYGPHEPALRIAPGDSVRTTTLDAGGLDEHGKKPPPEMFQNEMDTELQLSNPQTGPIYVENSEPGDMLKVHIDEIELIRDWAWSRHNPGMGILGIEDRVHGPTGLNKPLPSREYRWIYSKDRTKATLQLNYSQVKEVSIPTHPFLGCIGVCPRNGEVVSTMTPYHHGGNMDCVDTAVNTTVYLPVYRSGALLMFGDGHGAQGDGEDCGSALETPTRTTLTIDLVKNKPINWPRLENDNYIMTVANTRPLIDAVRIAKVSMVRWLVADYGFDQWDALQLQSQAGLIRVGNVVDPLYTVVAKFPKALLS
jgi:acetamidase/formamidase